jgi:hypothetical protein
MFWDTIRIMSQADEFYIVVLNFSWKYMIFLFPSFLLYFCQKHCFPRNYTYLFSLGKVLENRSCLDNVDCECTIEALITLR